MNSRRRPLRFEEAYYVAGDDRYKCYHDSGLRSTDSAVGEGYALSVSENESVQIQLTQY